MAQRTATHRAFMLATTLALALVVSGCAERRLAPTTEPGPVTTSAVPGAEVAETESGGARADTRDWQPRRGRRVVTGLASYYGRAFHGKETASGTTFNMHHLVAAHPHYPFGTRVRVTNLENGRKVVVRVVDRGPTQENVDEGVIIDLSRRAAAVLGFISDGRQRVRLEILEWGDT